MVHNGWLQALVDGGLVLAVPVVLVTGWPALRALRRILAGRRAGANAVQLGASAAVLVLLAHALFDVDWQYPSLLALYRRARRAAALAELGARGGTRLAVTLLRWSRQACCRRGRPGSPGGAERYGPGAPAGAAAPVGDLRSTRSSPFQQWSQRAPVALQDGRRLLEPSPMDDQLFDQLMASTQRAAEDDPALAQVRALALARQGDLDDALALSDRVLTAEPRPPVILLRAEVLEAVGDGSAARLWVELNLARLQELQGNVPTADLEKWLDVRSDTRSPGSASAQPDGAGSGGVEL